MIDNDTEWELAELASRLPPNMFIRYDAVTNAWLVVETKKDAPGIKVIAHDGTITGAIWEAIGTLITPITTP